MVVCNKGKNSILFFYKPIHYVASLLIYSLYKILSLNTARLVIKFQQEFEWVDIIIQDSISGKNNSLVNTI